MKILALIPARGGSKGVKYKNLRNVYGKPLIEYSIETALNTPDIDLVAVSTEDEQIASVSKDLGVKCKFCHNMNDKSIDPPHKEIAREMIILTRQINKHLHSLHKDKEEENVTITCWTCHKGKTEVEPKRPVEE